MAVSEDLRSVQAMLSGLQEAVPTAHHRTVRLLCENLLALADQAEALEEMPLTEAGITDSASLPKTFVPMEVLRVARFAAI